MNDMRIFTEFPKLPWMHSLYYIGTCLRLKREVEDRNYPPPKFLGRMYLLCFVVECIMTDHKIADLCNKYKIPLREDNQ